MLLETSTSVTNQLIALSTIEEYVTPRDDSFHCGGFMSRCHVHLVMLCERTK